MTRQTKTPQQRATEALAVAQRKRDRLHKLAKEARTALEVLDRDLAAADTRLDYAKKNPDLPATAQDVDTTPGGTTA